MSAIRTGSGGVSANAQLDLPVSPGMSDARILMKRFDSALSPDEVGAHHAPRTKIVDAFLDSLGRGLRPRLALFQNRQDTRQYLGHFLPFCRATGAPEAGGLSDDSLLLTRVLDLPGGHHVGHETIRQMLSGIPHVLGENFEVERRCRA